MDTPGAHASPFFTAALMLALTFPVTLPLIVWATASVVTRAGHDPARPYRLPAALFAPIVAAAGALLWATLAPCAPDGCGRSWPAAVPALLAAAGLLVGAHAARRWTWGGRARWAVLALGTWVTAVATVVATWALAGTR